MLTDEQIFSIGAKHMRDIADGDYIAARLAYRADLMIQFLWSSQQALEKYFKTIILLNRIEAPKLGHNLMLALEKIRGHSTQLKLTNSTFEFLKWIDQFGMSRYLEHSVYMLGEDIIRLDRSVWELRRFCTQEQRPRSITLVSGQPPPLVNIKGGYLETLIHGQKSHARTALLWQNAFFGKRRRAFRAIEAKFQGYKFSILS